MLGSTALGLGAAIYLTLHPEVMNDLLGKLEAESDRRADETMARLMAERDESQEPDHVGNWIAGHLERGDRAQAMQVAVENDPIWVRRLLEEQGVSPNLRLSLEGSESWSTPLGEAAKHGFADSVSFLLRADADVNAVDSSGWTALHAAAFFGHSEVVGLLLAAGADPALVTGDGLTALDLARSREHGEIVVILDGA